MSGGAAMILQAILFYLFAAAAVAAGAMVVAARNPVHSVLFLILAFFNTAGLFVLIGAEFLAMILVIVYVGAVAVLFLFVVMMLDIDFAELRSGFVRYLPIGALVGLVLLAELVLVSAAGRSPLPGSLRRRALPAGGVALTNTRALGDILYTRYLFAFQAAGLDPAGRDDRRDRADPAPSRRCAAAIDLGPARAHARPVGRGGQGAGRQAAC